MGIKTALYSHPKSGGQYAIEDHDLTTGNRFFVDSRATDTGDATGKGLTPSYPFATINYAIGKCTANNGDIIYVMPGHAETLSTASDILMNVIGVKIKGLGQGSMKPVISVDTEHTEEAGFLISAANCWIENIRFVGINAGGSKNAIGITAVADTTIKGCDFIETTTDLELGIGAEYGVITLLDTAAAITRVNILNCTMHGLGGNTESFLSVTNGSNGATYVVIDGCTIIGTFADDVIQADAGDNVNTNWFITNTMLANEGGNDLCLTIDTTAVFFMDRLSLFGNAGATIPIVGYNASYMGRVWSCEPGAYPIAVGSITNWS